MAKIHRFLTLHRYVLVIFPDAARSLFSTFKRNIFLIKIVANAFYFFDLAISKIPHRYNRMILIHVFFSFNMLNLKNELKEFSFIFNYKKPLECLLSIGLHVRWRKVADLLDYFN